MNRAWCNQGDRDEKRTLSILGFRLHPCPKPVNRFHHFIGRAWRWILPACCISWLALFPGVAVLDYFLGFESLAVTLSLMLSSFFFLFLAYWTSIQHDRLALKRLGYSNEKPFAVQAGDHQKVSDAG